MIFFKKVRFKTKVQIDGILEVIILKGGPILGVKALKDGILEISFDSGNRVILDMKPKFISYRFGVLSNPEIFGSVDTDGNFIRWYKNGITVAELGFGEIMKMTIGDAY